MNSLQHVLLFFGFPLPVPIEGTTQLHRRRNTFDGVPLPVRAPPPELQPPVEQAMAELLRKNQLLETSDRAKVCLFAAAIHDLRQPLQALMLFSNALSSADLDTDRLHRRIEQIRQSVDFLDRLLTGLLDLTQIEAGRTPPRCADLALDPLLDEVRHHFRAVAEAQGVRLVVRPTGAWARCDGVMLARILNNLVSNSLRHTHHGGVLVGARRHREGIRIDVCDTGVGIPPQHQTQVFEAFYRIDAPEQSAARGRGLGLGLATVQRLADLQGATVRLRSRPGQGTVVSVVLPAASGHSRFAG
jgi:signal transduction histidine kinase